MDALIRIGTDITMTELVKLYDTIDIQPIKEIHSFNSIYEELLHEVSVDNSDYIDPAGAAKILAARVQDVFEDYYNANYESELKLYDDMNVLKDSLLPNSTEYNQIKTHLLARKFGWE